MFALRTDWPLVPNRLSEAVAERRRAGLALLDLTESNPTRCGFDYPAREILAALADSRALVYRPEAKGLASARAAVAAYYAERGVDVSPERVILAASTSEAYAWVFRLLANPGDTVLVPQPSYPLFPFLGEINDVTLVPYPLRYESRWEIDQERFDAQLHSARSSTSVARAALVVHPNNPTGSYVAPSDLEFLVSRCRRDGMALIADEVFLDYSFDRSSRAFSHAGAGEVLTFTLSGLSKVSLLPQMKLAWLVVGGPTSSRQAALERLEIIADTYLSVNAPVAEALPSLLRAGLCMQRQVLARLRRNLQGLDLALSGHPVLRRLGAEGGWYAILQRTAEPNDAKSDEDWATELVTEAGVLVHPGHFYDFAVEGFFVLSLLPAPEIFDEAVQRLLNQLGI